MFERSSNGSRGLRVDSMLAIVAYLTIITQLCCLICSAQYRITNIQKKDQDQSLQPVVLDRLRRIAASCSTVRLAPSSNRLVCVPFAERQMQIPETFINQPLLDGGDKICSLGSVSKLSEDELASCLDRIERLFIGNRLRLNSDRSMARLKPYRRYLFGSPKRSTDETQILEWPMAKAFLKELQELDGKSEISLSNRTNLPAGELAAAPLAAQVNMASAESVATTAITSTENTNNVVAGDDAIKPTTQAKSEVDEEALECRLREYTFKAVNKDREGNHCSGYITAAICYGGCETGEISDWLFPHKKSIHKVCQHGLRARRKAILTDCNSFNAYKELSIYHYVDARSCKCEKCNKANTTCMGSLTAPKL